MNTLIANAQHPHHFLHNILLLAIMQLASGTVVAASDATFEVETGTEYDSNLSIIELDQNSAENDWALVANARMNGQWQANRHVKLKGGLSYNTKTWNDYSAYDLKIKQAFADASYEFKPFTLGVSFHHADAKLDDRDFLTLQQRSIYASRLVNQRFFLRAAVNHQNKDFPGSNIRNANNQSMAGDMFVFFNQGKTFLTLGISNEEERARADQFDYDGINLRTSISHQFTAWNKPNRVQFGVRYDNRDYLSITPELEKKRSDQRRIATLEWDVATSKWLSITTKFERGNYASNIDSADYAETIGSVLLKASF
ncbi:MAG TPA: hypothetical protein VL995_14240 [Cellvibrio sp.]|nr:hypothetical protein [Cellvibrio sp.]